MKLGLGTVQFGLDYGIANKDGKVDDSSVSSILAHAQQASISIIDTAAQYGTSEEILGRTMAQNNNFKIVTKTPFIASDSINQADANLIRETFYSSLKKLCRKSIYGLLLHNTNDMYKKGFEFIWQAMQELQKHGLVEKIGISVYTGQQIDFAIDHYQPDLVQLPFNVFDQRLLQSGHLEKLKKNNIEIHARSVFLQGLLLMDPNHVPTKLNDACQHLKKYHDKAAEYELSPLEASLAFAMQKREIDCVLVGVCSLIQLQQIITAATKAGDTHFDFAPFAVHNEKILNPALWG